MFYIGNYYINLKFGNTIIPVTPSMIEEITITQDIDRFLPTFKLAVKDATGLLGEIAPFDKNLNLVSLEIARNVSVDDLNEFNFTVDRRSAISNKDYVIQGVLNVSGLFDPEKTRALTGLIKSNLESISEDELNISNTEVGASLNYEKTIVQPKWNNAKLLRYLKSNLIGRNNEAGYYCFIKNIHGEPTFVFKSVNELFVSPVQYKFIVGHKEYKDFYPVNEFRVFDDSKLVVGLAAKTQEYSYFDYSTGTYTSSNVSIDDYPSLVEHHLVDDDDATEGISFSRLGRSNDFTEDFGGRVRNDYYERITSLISMWISTWGLENIAPGDIVKVIFSEALQRGKLFLYQHSGYWMVKRVVHVLTNSFMTNLLLVRSGIDTDIETTLAEAKNQKRKKV